MPVDGRSGAVLLYGIPKVIVGENETFVGEGPLRSRGVALEVLQDSHVHRLDAAIPFAITQGSGAKTSGGEGERRMGTAAISDDLILEMPSSGPRLGAARTRSRAGGGGRPNREPSISLASGSGSAADRS